MTPLALALSSNNMSHHARPRVIPITIFSGFLGSGKTSLLQHLLHNNEGCRIAVIVNDVASMNIDSKLVSQQGTGGAAGIVQLQNGCACCSLSDELLSSVSELVTLSDLRAQDEDDDACFDHIVIELSGLADPKSVRAKFQEAVLYDMPLMERVQLDTMVSLVDCSVFLNQLSSSQTASPDEAPELFYRDGVKPETPDWQASLDDDDEEDLPPGLLEALMAGERAYGGDGSNGVEQDTTVVDLLVSQCEIADIVLLNKKDLATPQDMDCIDKVVTTLNPRATVIPAEYGRLPLDQILAVAKGRGVAQAGLVDDHKDFVQAATAVSSHVHGHDHHTEKPLAGPVVESAVDNGHAHEHADAHAHDHHTEEPAASPVVESAVDNGHSHAHSHAHNEQCHEPKCDDPSHDHDHSHKCEDPTCTDTSHSHSHDHFAHGNLGTFVFRARRPFHPERLVAFLQHLSVTRGLPKDVLQVGAESRLQVSESCKSLLKGILRSKGFVWCADSDEAAMFWSHAGISFEMSCLGRWWATLDRSQWPAEALPSILQDFDSADHDEKDPSFKSVGDRRQEVVFIGPNLGKPDNQGKLADVLEQCLLQDEEWNKYCTMRSDGPALRAAFVNPCQVKMVTY